MTDKKRDPLPEGYQCGDAALMPAAPGLSAMTPPLTGPGAEYRRLYNAAKAAEHQLGAPIFRRLEPCFHCGSRDHGWLRCATLLRKADAAIASMTAEDWNVIEGEHFTTNRDHGDEA